MHADTGVLHIQLLKRCRKGRYWAGGRPPQLQQLEQGSLQVGALEGADSRGGEGGGGGAPPAAPRAGPAEARDVHVEQASSQQVLSLQGPQRSAVVAAPPPPSLVVTAADTFWVAVFVDAPEGERLAGPCPPTAYYFCEVEGLE